MIQKIHPALFSDKSHTGMESLLETGHGKTGDSVKKSYQNSITEVLDISSQIRASKNKNKNVMVD